MLPPEQLIQGKERAIFELQRRTIQAIVNQQPISIFNPGNLGSAFIYAGAARYVLELFSRANNLKQENVVISQKSVEGETPQTLPLYRQATFIAGNLQYVHNQSLYGGVINQLAGALGVQLPSDYQNYVPLPVKIDTVPFQTYNEAKVLQRAKILKDQFATMGKKLLVLVQTGSIAVKRFNDAQILYIANVLRECYPDGYIFVLSDREFKKDNTQPIYLPYVDGQYTGSDINERMAYAAAAEHGFSTDSSGSHYLAGGMALVENPPGKLSPNRLTVLYTVGNYVHFAIPNAHIVKSDALKQRRLRVLVSISPKEYRNFNGMNDQDGHVSNNDVLKYCAVIRANT